MATIEAIPHYEQASVAEIEGAYAARSFEPVTHDEYVPEPEFFVDSLEGFINSLRLPDDRYYRDLIGPERAALPSVESQVQSVEAAICSWLGEAVSDAVEADFSPEDKDYALNGIQVNELCARARATRTDYTYWKKDYDTTGENESGRFVKWTAHRRVRSSAAQTIQEILTRHRTTYAGGTLFSQLKPDLSVVARLPETRRTAYDARMNAKIGLACMRLMIPERTHYLADCFQIELGDITPQTATVDLMELFRNQEEAVARLELPWSASRSTADQDMPF